MRSRRGASSSSHNPEQPDTKENIEDRSSVNNSPLSFDYSESDNEENASMSQSNEDNEMVSNCKEKLETHESQITDTMRKAFDIMLHKNFSKLSSATSTSLATVHVTNCDANLTKGQLNIVEQNFSHSNFSEGFTNPVSNQDYISKTQNAITTDIVPGGEIASSSLETQTASSCSNFTIQSCDLPCNHNLQTEVRDNVADYLSSESALNISNEMSFASSNIQSQLCPCLPEEDEQKQWLYTFSAPSIYSEQLSKPLSSPSSSNFTENDDDGFGSPTNFVPMNLDQISPSIDFLPPDSDEMSYYTNSFSPKSFDSAIEQSNPNFVNHPTETYWVLAQLN